MALGSYHDFIQSMLGLREQRLKEAQLQQAERLAQQKQMMEMVGDIGSAITSGYQTGQQNQMANQLMEETYGAPPRAQAVNPSMQGPADAAAQRMPGFYTGGMPELKMRMGMAEDLSQARYRDAMINRMGENLKFQKSKWLTGRAEALDKKGRTALDDDYDDHLKYITKRKAFMDALGNSANQEQYDSNVDAITSLDAAARKRGLKTEEFDQSKIPPFMSEDDKTALGTQQTAVNEARTALEEAKKAPPGLVERMIPYTGVGAITEALGYKIPSEKAAGVLTAQQLYEQEQQKLRETPGASFYGEKPITPKTETPKTTTTGGGNGGDTIPLEAGTRRRGKKTGRVQIWNGRQWVDE